MQALRKLPTARILGALTISGRKLQVHLENPSQALAFQVQLAAKGADGQPVIPLLWTDDFVELMPGEQRTLSAPLPEKYSGGVSDVVVTGWNIYPLTLQQVNKNGPNSGANK